LLNLNSSYQTGRIPELDGLRGVAIGMVLVWHYFIVTNTATPGSLFAYALVPGRIFWSGVDLFFVLSGFLIGGILLDARESSNYFKVFYARRFYRIVPIYVVCLTGVMALSLLMQWRLASRLGWMLENRLPWFPYLVFLQNFWMAHANTLGAFGLGATWSLAVEEQFYLTLPSLVRFLSPRRLVIALAVGVIMAPCLRILLHALWPGHAYSWVLLMPCRADALLLGVLGAIAVRADRWRVIITNNRRALQLVLGLLGIGFAYLTLRAPNTYGVAMFTFGFTWLASFYLCVLLYAVSFRDSWTSRCLRFGWLCWLGSIAYGTYLLHEFVLGAIFGFAWSQPPLITNASQLGAAFIALALTLAICQLSWKYFEKPLVRMGHRLNYSFGIAKGSTWTTSTVKGVDTATP
jgi:peptidoglycan/LPS O-acetylase OafA/YrhL